MLSQTEQSKIDQNTNFLKKIRLNLSLAALITVMLMKNAEQSLIIFANSGSYNSKAIHYCDYDTRYDH